MLLFLLTDSPQKLKLENIHDTLIILFYVILRSPQLQRLFFLLIMQKMKSAAAVDPEYLKVKIAD